jgi:hypothetical protein
MGLEVAEKQSLALKIKSAFGARQYNPVRINAIQTLRSKTNFIWI